MKIFLKLITILLTTSITKPQFIFTSNQILTFHKKTIISKTSIFQKIEIYDIRILALKKILIYKIHNFFKFSESLKPIKKLIYYKNDDFDSKWQKLPPSCPMPIFDNEKNFKIEISSLCKISENNGRNSAEALSLYFFQNNFFVFLNEKNFFVLKNDFFDFLKKPENEKKIFLEDFNEKLVRDYRERIYCHLEKFGYDVNDVEDICYKKGFIVVMKKYLTEYIKTVNTLIL